MADVDMTDAPKAQSTSKKKAQAVDSADNKAGGQKKGEGKKRFEVKKVRLQKEGQGDRC